MAVAVSRFGAEVQPKLGGSGQPEDQMRGPLETLLKSVARSLGLELNPVGETSLSELRVRADYAIEVDGALVGYVEVKAPGKGVDPQRWGAKSHDRLQWEKLRGLPNVLYTDGNEWALYRRGERLGDVVQLAGNVRTHGDRLGTDGPGLASILDSFLRWEPIPPRTLKQLVNSVAGLCRLLREEVAEALRAERQDGGPFTRLAADWRELLFPEADDAQFADGYAQTVTFALLLARVERIDFAGQPMGEIARQLGRGHSLMGKALDVLTDDSLGTLTRTIDTLLRVVGAVDWGRFEGGRKDPYLHLYEDFLEVYDPELRKQTGSYYTPVEVVENMVRLVDGLLKNGLGQPLGFASDEVVVVDPAMGTGTYLLNVIEQAAEAIMEEEGSGAVPARLRRMASRVIGFERQAGPYAVAEMRSYEALRRRHTEAPADGLRLYVADTLDNPDAEHAHMYAGLEPIARSRRAANKVKRDEPVMVVIGNPPYRDKAKGLGGWIEAGNGGMGELPPIDAFRAEGNGKYEYVLSNLYVYFWRWATWKVFDHHADAPAGVVAFITPSGFTTGPGFAGMREYLRRAADEGWIIDLTPEGHQPDVATRIFPHVQQPLCIAILVRYGNGDSDIPAKIHHTRLKGSRRIKFEQLATLDLGGEEWLDCGDSWREPFTPAGGAEWAAYPPLADLLPWVSPGVKTERAWVIDPDAATLQHRWRRLVADPNVSVRNELLKTSRNRTVHSRPEYLPQTGDPSTRMPPLSDEPVDAASPEVVRYGLRSFDRQYLLADHRLMYPARPDLWAVNSPSQMYVAEQHAQPIESGPALTFSSLLPDMHFFNGRGGRVMPLYRDALGGAPNLAPGLADHIASVLGVDTNVEDIAAYAAAVVAHPAFTQRFRDELSVPGVRIPFTANRDLYDEAVEIGREIIWLHTYGERCVDASSGRPSGPPRTVSEQRAKVVVAIPHDEENMPNEIKYDQGSNTLLVGDGEISPVSNAVWDYEVSGMRVVRKWFGYRKKISAGRRSSALDEIRPRSWTSAMTSELLNLLNVLERLVSLESAQADLLDRVLGGPQVTVADLTRASVFPVSEESRKSPSNATLLDEGGQLTVF
ncbi:type ISP restriction/modification enzyme [Lentzea sp. NPDC051213]|uniref:type ISP restriction/modification enzyme n=1 Tax=Lentzea sp. NPDC051213 TaxID=3364126 RepID=UPI0037BC0425